ncbi:MAG: hypothetical protein IJ856_00275 [Candidatus Methanomethylophilaceae archaeon]|nr:hypothetical protein [Candidatus Methanomethylophilaceae archaeon]
MALEDEVPVEIHIHVGEEADLYCRFDPSHSRLDDDLCSYLVSEVSKLKPGKQVKIAVESPVMLDEDRVRMAFRGSLNALIDELDRQKRFNVVTQFRLLVIGLAFISVWIAASSYMEGIWPEVLSIIGSFAVWEASNIWIVENPRLFRKRRQWISLANAKVTCVKID